MAGLDLTLHRRQTGDGSIVCFEVTREAFNDIWYFIKDVGKRTDENFRVRIDRPFRPRSTGYRSQNSRHWGHCDDIAVQLTVKGKHTYSKEEVDAALRRMSVIEGLPTFLNIDGVEEPIHFSEMSVDQANAVERVKQRFCDTHNLWLTEYDDTCNLCHGEMVVRDLGTPGTRKCPECKGSGKAKAPVSYRSLHGRTRREMEEYVSAKSERESGDRGDAEDGIF